MNALTADDVLTFAFAGCNAAEVGAFAGVSEAVAQARIDAALAAYEARTWAMHERTVAQRRRTTTRHHAERMLLHVEREKGVAC